MKVIEFPLTENSWLQCFSFIICLDSKNITEGKKKKNHMVQKRTWNKLSGATD